MTLQQLLASKPKNVRFDLPPQALQRWNPELQAAADDDENSISILEPIGFDFWTGEGVTAKRIGAALRSIGAGNPVTVNINSPGGDVFEGLAIYSLLKEHRGQVTVNVLSLAASAASTIAMAGDTIRIAKAGFFMIHNTWTVAAGDRHYLAEIGDWLAPFDDAMAGIYEDRTGNKKTELAKMMDSETWINGSASIDQGFADDYLASDAVSANARADAVASAVRKMDVALAQAGMSRNERRQLIQEFKASMPRAAGSDGTPRATSPGNTQAAVVNVTPGTLIGSVQGITTFVS